MSSVTRVHLLSQSMLNVSCQKQELRSSLPADSLTESPMEFLGQPSPFGACNLLGVPGLSSLDVDDEEGEFVIGIIPKSSPLPQRRSSECIEDYEPEFEPPLCGSRKVSFADAKGLNLVQVKEFATWDVPKLPYDYSEGEGKDAEEYFLSPLTFSLPLSPVELFARVREQKIELETIELLPGTTILKGMIRVLNISFNKTVNVRTTLNAWSSHFDLLAEYISSEDLMDLFSFRLTLVPPFGEQGARVDFCLRYETTVGTFWANNNGRNYVLFCHRVKEKKEKSHQKEHSNRKSCLKIASQNFSTVENISAMEASSQENISGMSKNEEKVVTKAKQNSDDQSEEQILLSESRRNSSRRSRRKAARMARVQHIFAQRNGGANDTEKDESPPEAKEATQEENHSDRQSFSERISTSEGSQFVPESLETSSGPLIDVIHDTSPSHDYTSNSDPEKSENINLADSATVTGVGENAIPENPLHSNDEPVPAECQNVNTSVSNVEESCQKQDTSYDCASNFASEAAVVISAVGSESLVSQTNSFTFGTVVAPLYQQAFGRTGSESQLLGDWGNPAHATVNVGDLTESYHHTEKSETSCNVLTDPTGKNEKVKVNVIMTQESNQECLDDPTSINAAANYIPDRAEILQDPVEIIHSDSRCTNASEVPKTISGDTVAHSHAVNILDTDLLNSQITMESLHLQGETQEDNLTHDLRSQTTVETTQAQLLECICRQMKTNPEETQEAMASLETSIVSQSMSECVSEETDQQSSGEVANDSECVDESNIDNDLCKAATLSKTSAILEEVKPVEVLHDLDPNQINDSAPKETEKSYVSSVESVKEKDVTTTQISSEKQEETNNGEETNKAVNNLQEDDTKQSAEIKVIGEVAESMTKAVVSNCHKLKDEGASKEEAVIVSEESEHHKIEATVPKEVNLCLAESSEVKNWEMMVEEEETDILTDDIDSETIVFKEDIVAVEIDKEEQFEEKTTSENVNITETTVDEMVAEIMAAKEMYTMAEDADFLDDKQRVGEEETKESAAEQVEVEKELESIQATKEEKKSGEDDLAEETDVKIGEDQEQTGLEKEQHFVDIQEVNIESVEEEDEELDSVEDMEIDLSDEEEAAVEWEDQVNKNIEEENPDYKEEIGVEEAAGEPEIVDAESEIMTVEVEDRGYEVGCFEESLDIAQIKVEDGLSALVDKRVIDQENILEGQNAHIPNEIRLSKELDFQSNDYVTLDQSNVGRDEKESAAAEGDLWLFADELESDQTCHDSASAESDSDDEVELYMHCLRAVHTGEKQAHKDRNKDTGFSVGRRPSISRSKLLSTPMPSISESLDEEQQLGCLQDSYKEIEPAEFQPADSPLPVSSSGQESMDRKVSWWRETFSCRNISKTLLFATLLVLFLVVAHHYDFVACFGLYLITVVWLHFQGERQPVKKTTKE